MKKILMAIMMVTTMTLMPATVQARTLIDFGDFTLTAYCPCEECSEGWGRKTATPNVYARSEHTIAIDPDVIPLGSKVKIGETIYTAEDTGGMINDDHIDIFFDTHEEVVDFGKKTRQVWVVKE